MADRADYDSDVRVLEWEIGLPSASDLTPLTQLLVPPELASAFGVKPEPVRTNLDVQRGSQETLTSLRRHGSSSNSSPQFPQFDDSMAAEGEDPSDSRVRESSGGEDPDARARALKRPRLVWTPRLHKRFVEVVAHLGIGNAVPKTIMQLMNVEGLTRENVASHLQKYRLYLKRIQGLSNEGPSPSDPLFASIPVPQNLQEHNDSTSNNNNQMPAQQQQQQQLVQPVVAAMPYAVPTMIPMPMYGVPLLPPGSHHNGAMGMVPVNNGHYEAYSQYGHYEAYHQYGNHGGVQYQFGGYGENQGNDWGNGSKFGSSVVSYPPPNVTSSDK